MPVTATPRRKSYRSTAYDTSLSVKEKKEKLVKAAVAAGARAGSGASEEEWPSGVQPLKAGTVAQCELPHVCIIAGEVM